MPRRTVSNALVGIAGVHYVASELSRRGLIALPTIRNTAGYDIIVATPDGEKHANIQVKTSLKRVKYWPVPLSDRVCTKPKDYYVFLRWAEKEKRFECFMVTGCEVKQEVEVDERSDWSEKRRREGKPLFPCIPCTEEPLDRWKRQWEDWSL